MEAGGGGIRSVGEPAVDEGVLLVGSRRAVPHVHQYGRHVSESALHYCVRTRLVLHWDSAHLTILILQMSTSHLVRH